MNRRSLVLILAFTLIQIAQPQSMMRADVVAADNAKSPFLGVWKTHFEQTCFIIIIKPDRTANFLLLEDGSHQISEVTWKPAAGGLIVNSLPRFRFWNGPKDHVVRAQMEPLPPDWTSSSLQRFPLSFYMRRDDLKLPLQFQNRALPTGWTKETPPAEFEAQLGRPRAKR